MSTYYVDPSGSDSNNGLSTATPFKNWEKLGTVMVAGDNAYVRGGTYITPYTALNVYIHCDWSGLSGSVGSPITIENYPGESPVFDFSSLGNSNRDYSVGLMIENCSYVNVKGLRITGMLQITNGSGVCIGNSIENSTNITMENCSFDNIGGYGTRLGNSNNITYINCDAYKNQDPYSTPAYDGSDGFNGSGGETSTNTIYIGCRSWWNSDDGWDFYSTDGTRYLYNCWSFWNGYIPGTFNTAGNGNGFKLGPANTNQSANITKYLNNCIAFQNRSNGFDQNDGQSRFQIYNCTSYRNGGYGFEFPYYSGITQDFKNNVAYNNTGSNFHGGDNATGSYNTWNGIVTVNDSDFVNLLSSEMTGSRKSDGSLPDITFLHLIAGSDLINAGIDVGIPYIGSAPDLGAFEYSPPTGSSSIVFYINGSKGKISLNNGKIKINKI